MKFKYVKTRKDFQRENVLTIGFWIFIIFCIFIIANKMVEWASINPYWHF